MTRFLSLFSIVFVAFVTLFFTLGWLTSEQTAFTLPSLPPPQTAIISPELQAKMAESPNTPIPFILTLHQQAKPIQKTENDNRISRRTDWIARLQNTAAASQPPVLQAMRQLDVPAIRPFWIVNSIAGESTAVAIRQLAALPEVARIDLDASWQAFPVPNRAYEPDRAYEIEAVQMTSTQTQSWGISQIGADKVWQGFGIEGQGVTVAIMDTGVDFLHADLVPNYRGNLGGGLFNHDGNWFDAVVPTNTIPIDMIGHGTHVAGTAVGQNGIGVAPGAQWIAVNIAGPFGLIYTSDARAGFQWLLAPDGNSALAPDVINASWSGPSESIIFLDDVNALHAAGIIPVFAAGNNGPFAESVGSPASYTNTLAIAATDDQDTIAWFSSRGPSPLNNQPHPTLAAPGTAIYSTQPNNQYGLSSGTSMATPHTVGTIALLLSANPVLTPIQVTAALTSTAVPLGSPTPNNDSGWGRLDAYTAVSQQVTTGDLDVTLIGQSGPLPGEFLTITTPSLANMSFATDNDGRLVIPLPPGNFTVTAAPFGYQPALLTANIVTNATTFDTILLSPLPQGVVNGVVLDELGQPLSLAVNVLNTPVSTQSGSDGNFSIPLPTGVYTIRVGGVGYELSDQTVLINAGTAVTINFTLIPAPSVLLVDSGQWYYGSQARFFSDALTQNRLPHDTLPIVNPYDALTAAELSPYEVVVWSAPIDSPGFLGLSLVISDYLDMGGNLFISGQDVGYFDGSGFTQWWWYRHLAGDFLGETTVTQTISGLPGTKFDGLSLTLNNGSSADNQFLPDVSQPRPGSLTQPIFQFEDGRAAGLQAGLCQPYRIAYLGFGLEGISDAGDRADVMKGVIDYFLSPRQTAGLMWASADVDEFALAGDMLAYTLTLRNLSETMTDTFTIQTSGGSWPTAVTTPTLTLGPCQSAETVVSLTVPNTAVRDEINDGIVTAVSTNQPAISTSLNLHHKIPGRILLVGDERWYDQRPIYTAALDELGLPYDLWWTGWNQMGRESPPARILAAYDIILWYTGYDWFQPVTISENQALVDFLDGGGRLFLSSQDFMYYHHQTPLAQQYFGAIAYQESVTPTIAFAGGLFPTLAGPLPFVFDPYQNNGDLLIPGADSQPILWHEQGVGGIITIGESWRTMLWGVPLEKLPPSTHAPALAQVLGWLGDLGDSTIETSKRTAVPGQTLPFTLTIRNDANAPPNTIALTNTLPPGLSLNPETLSDGIYDPANRRLTWQGALNPGAQFTITYQATVDVAVPPNSRFENELTLYYPRHQITFSRTVVLWVTAPDMSNSTIHIAANSPQPTRRVTATLTIPNDGTATGVITASLRLPDALTPLTNTVTNESGTAIAANHHLTWTGTISPSTAVSVSIVLTAPIASEPSWLPFTAFVDDGVTEWVIGYEQVWLRPYSHYLPLIAQDGIFQVSSPP